MGGTHPGRARERDRGPAEPGASGLSPAAQVEGGCPMDVRTTIDQVVRASYGRLVAFLAARSRDVAGAEDARAEAFQAALVPWPRTGIPEKPEAWLLVTARRRLIDAARHARVHAEAAPSLLAAAAEAQEMTESAFAFPDERLKLLFVCAHPAIDPNVHTLLMLQTVLGLDAARIAAAFLVQPAAMGQRLTRAKAKIRDARVAFELPAAAGRAGRIGRYQLEAAIQSAHADRARTGRTDWESIALLYEGLVSHAPGIGALIGRAAAVAEARDAATAWSLLQMIPAEAVASYQPYWALAAHLLKRMGQTTQSADAYRRAIGLTEDSTLRAFLTAQMLAMP